MENRRGDETFTNVPVSEPTSTQALGGLRAAPLWALSPDPMLGNEGPCDVPPCLSPCGQEER